MGFATQLLIIASTNIAMTAGTAKTPTAPCRLLDLPAELRCCIYSLVFGESAQELEYDMDGAFTCSSRGYSLNPELLRTCHQIYAEALPVLYDVTTFTLSFISTRNMYFEHQSHSEEEAILDTVRLNLITSLKIYSDFDDAASHSERLDLIKRFLVKTGHCLKMRYLALQHDRHEDGEYTDEALALFETLECSRDVVFKFEDVYYSGKFYEGTAHTLLCQKLQGQASDFSSENRVWKYGVRTVIPFPNPRV